MTVCVLGSINLDIVCQVAELPRPGETVMSRQVRRFPGGKGLNQAVAAARWGAATAMIGAVGADGAGSEMIATLAEAGADTSAVRTVDGAATGHGYIFVSDAGENMIVVAGGANLAVTAADVQVPARRVYLAQLETPLAAIEALFSLPGALAGTRILNAAPAAREGRALFDLADIVIVNQTELASYASADEPPEDFDAVVPLARRLTGRPDQTVVVTLGAAGAAAVTAERSFHVAGLAARVADTTGAGDCFCGVLAAALSEGEDLAAAMVFANAAAALSTQTAGAATSLPTRSEVERFMAGSASG